jgi:hypothetical protein
MHRNRRNNDYRTYYYLPLSISTSSQNTYYQYYDSRVSTQQSSYSNIITRFRPSTTISDLAEPISVFDDLKFPRYDRSVIIPFLPVYVPSNPNQRASVSDVRLARANAVRERLLIDIQHNIREIDRELSSLERRPAISRYLLPPLPSINKQTVLSNDDNHMQPNKPKRIYDLVPRMTNNSKIVLQRSISTQTNQTNLPSYIGKYHYAPEIEEIEIVENDPENSDLKSTTDEMSKFSFHETLSLGQFRREQSDLSQNRALIFVPEYGDHNEIKYNEAAKDFHQNDPIDTNTAQLSTVNSTHNLGSANQLNNQNIELSKQTAPEFKTEISFPEVLHPEKFTNIIKTDLDNTMITKPVKHSSSSTNMATNAKDELSSSQQTTTNSTNRKNNVDGDVTYIYIHSGSGNESGNVKARRSVNPSDPVNEGESVKASKSVNLSDSGNENGNVKGRRSANPNNSENRSGSVKAPKSVNPSNSGNEGGSVKGRRSINPSDPGNENGNVKGRRSANPNNSGNRSGSVKAPKSVNPSNSGNEGGSVKGRRSVNPSDPGNEGGSVKGRRSVNPSDPGNESGSVKAPKSVNPSNSGNEGGSVKGRRSINPSDSVLPTETTIVADNIISNNIITKSQTFSSKEQLAVENNNENVKETENKKDDATMKRSVTVISIRSSSLLTSN